jgi:hypothetical protein
LQHRRPWGGGCPSDAAAPWTTRLTDGADSTLILTRGTLPIALDDSVTVMLGGALAKLDSAGQIVWSQPRTTPDAQAWLSPPQPDSRDCTMIIAGLIPNGQSVLLGQDLGCSGSYCPVVARLDAGGSPLWVRVYDFGGGGWVYPSIGGVSADGRIALVGAFLDTIDLGNGPLEAAPSTGSGLFVAQLASDGQALWSRRIAVQSYGWATGAAI